MSGPAVRRYTFSNQSVSGQPTSAPIETPETPESCRVCMSFVNSSQVFGGVMPALEYSFVLYQTVDLLEPLNQTP